MNDENARDMTRLPNFLIIGAPKGGTTALYHWLEKHPAICLSTPKEPHFFEDEDEHGRGAGHYWQTYFAPHWRGQPLIGEARTANFYLPFVPRRIHETVPDARLVAILRNPVERAFSHWWMLRCYGREPLGFDQALRANREATARGDSIESPRAEQLWRAHIAQHANRRAVRPIKVRHYIEVGHYATHLERYLQLFPREQLCVLLYDDLVSDPIGTMRTLCAFLGLDPSDVSQAPPREHVGLTRFSRPFYRVSQRLRLERFMPRRLHSMLRTQLSRIGSRPQMSAEAREWLRRHYEPHNRRLEALLGRDLSAWDA